MSEPAGDISVELDELFRGEPAGGAPAELLELVGTVCAPLVPQALAISDGDGEPDSAFALLATSGGRDWHRLFTPLLSVLRDGPLGEACLLAGPGAGESLVGIRFTTPSGRVGCLGLLTSGSPRDIVNDPSWNQRLAAAAALAAAALRADQEREEKAVRVEHLLAERATVLARHAEIVESNLNEREAAMQEKQRLISTLEHLVKRRTRELHAAMEEAENASRHKSEFLANMSHEIRTPMTAILGYADLLLEPGFSEEERRQALLTMQRNGRHLLALINDILDLSKIEAGKLVAERVPCSPHAVIAEVVSLMRVRAADKGLSLEVEFTGRIPATIQTDPTRLRQILVNLVGNAVKFTHWGGVSLRARFIDPVVASGSSAGEGLLQVDVVDTGIGLTEVQQSNLFQAFTQADTSMTRRYGGTGLGLAICKRLAEILGGDIAVTSESNRGSTFRATVATGSLSGVQMLEGPAELDRPGQSPAESDGTDVGPLHGRVLLAEDGPDNQRLFCRVLRRAGLEVEVAENGQVACDKARQAAAAGRPYDLILMDMQMPVLDGYEATQQLRQDGHRGPIVALTAHAMADDRARCLEAGCDDFATKPIVRRDLLAAIARHLGNGTHDQVDDQHPAT